MPSDPLSPPLPAEAKSAPPTALLVTDLEAAALLGICRATLHRLRAAGKLPRPVKLGRCLRWDRRELEAWIAAGAPALDHWDAMKTAAERRRLRA